MDILESSSKYASFLPILLWSILMGLVEWILPASWYAKRVDKDIVLITGAGSGLGRAIAVKFAKLNSSLILWDINEQGLEDTKALVEFEYVKKLERDATTNTTTTTTTTNCNKTLEEGLEKKFCKIYLVDVSDKLKVKEAAERVYKDLNEDGGEERYVSVLVNNAGIYHGLMLQELRDDQIERIFKINIMAHFWTVRAFLPKMIEHKRGHIIEIASMGGINGLLKQVDYCATKFATVGFEESLSIELDHLGLGDSIRTTVVCPLFFSSNLFSNFNENAAPMMTSEFVARETVMAMRCNHSRVMLPKFSAYSSYIAKSFLPRRAIIEQTRVSGFAEGIKEIKGKAAAAAIVA